MTKSLLNLPEAKREQIRHIVEIIREEANPEIVILFGSYAKGNFIEHEYISRDGLRYEYQSDYDFLVVLRESDKKEYELSDKIVNRSRIYPTPLNLEIHDIEYINEGLQFGQYFFSDIIDEGIILYDSEKINFSSAKKLSRSEEQDISKRYFTLWFKRGLEFNIDSKNAFERGSLNNSIFHLHQAVESFYYTALLVFTGYKPKTHNLSKLRQQAKSLSEELFLVFPIEANKHERHLFDLLRKGYVDARYREDYVITIEELQLLMMRVDNMRSLVETICSEEINSETRSFRV